MSGEYARTRMIGVKPTYVWDVSQTAGDPVPELPRPTLLQGQAPAGLWDGLADQITAAGFELRLVSSAAAIGGANGLTDFLSREVSVRMDMDDAAQVKTLAHELGHVLLHAPRENALSTEVAADATLHRGIAEVEAESVALMVGAAHGLDTSSYTVPYVSTWAASVPGQEPGRGRPVDRRTRPRAPRSGSSTSSTPSRSATATRPGSTAKPSATGPGRRLSSPTYGATGRCSGYEDPRRPERRPRRHRRRRRDGGRRRRCARRDSEQSRTRGDLRAVIDEITADLGAPVRVEVREADGIDVRRHRDSPRIPGTSGGGAVDPPRSTPALAGAGFQPGEEVALAYVVVRQTRRCRRQRVAQPPARAARRNPRRARAPRDDARGQSPRSRRRHEPRCTRCERRAREPGTHRAPGGLRSGACAPRRWHGRRGRDRCGHARRRDRERPASPRRSGPAGARVRRPGSVSARLLERRGAVPRRPRGTRLVRVETASPDSGTGLLEILTGSRAPQPHGTSTRRRRRRPSYDAAATLRPSIQHPRASDVGYLLGRSCGREIWASVEDSILVIGPPRSGKGLHLVINAILDAPGAVVTTSTRPDNIAATIDARQGTRTGRRLRPTAPHRGTARGRRQRRPMVTDPRLRAAADRDDPGHRSRVIDRTLLRRHRVRRLLGRQGPLRAPGTAPRRRTRATPDSSPLRVVAVRRPPPPTPSASSPATPTPPPAGRTRSKA